MIPAADIIDNHTDPLTEIVDLKAVNEAMVEGLQDISEGAAIAPMDVVAINELFVVQMFEFLEKIVFDIAEEVNALPSGRAVEEENFRTYMTHAKLIHVYELARMKSEVIDNASGLILPDNVVDISSIRGDDDDEA